MQKSDMLPEVLPSLRINSKGGFLLGELYE